MTSRKYDIIYKTVMADSAFTLTRDEQVTYIKIEPRQGKSMIEIQKVFEEVGSEFVLPYSSITRWVRHFNNGLVQSTSAEGLCRQRPVKMWKMLQNFRMMTEDIHVVKLLMSWT